MNKGILWVKLLILILMLGIILVFTYLQIFNKGTSSFGFINIGIFSVNEVSKHPDHKVIDTSKSVKIDDSEINEIDVNMVSGSLDIISYNGDDIVLEYSKLDNGDNLLYVTDNSTLKIESENRNRIFNMGIRKEGDVILKIPNSLVLDYDIDLISGESELVVNGNKLNIDNVSGNFTSTGDFQEIEVDTVSGNIDIIGNMSYLAVDGVSGNVSFEASDITKEVNIDTVSGDTFMKDKSKGYYLEFDSVSGDIKEDGKKFKNENYKVGNGEIEIEVDSVSGDFVVESNQ